MSANSSCIEIDVHGRGLDGISGISVEHEMHRQNFLGKEEVYTKQYTRHDNLSTACITSYIERDLYGRGDLLVYGQEAASPDPAKVRKPIASKISRRALPILPRFLKKNADMG